MNNINIIGRIGKEIELRYLQSGSAVASFSIAVDQSYKKDGQKIEKTSWFDVSAFGKIAETVNSFFNKGSMIGISGELEQQTWKAQDGSNRSKVIIKLQNLTFIDKKDNNQQGGQAPQQQQNYGQQQQGQQYQPQGQQQYGQPQQQAPQNNQAPAQAGKPQYNQPQQGQQSFQQPQGQYNPQANQQAPQQQNYGQAGQAPQMQGQPQQQPQQPQQNQAAISPDELPF